MEQPVQWGVLTECILRGQVADVAVGRHAVPYIVGSSYMLRSGDQP